MCFDGTERIIRSRNGLVAPPGAWGNAENTKVGDEIPFDRFFCVFEPPRPPEAIDAEPKQVTERIGNLAQGRELRCERPRLAHHAGQPDARQRGHGSGKTETGDRGPSTSAASFAQAISGSTAPKPAKVERPQSVPAITRSAPTRSTSRCCWATWSGAARRSG